METVFLKFFFFKLSRFYNFVISENIEFKTFQNNNEPRLLRIY